MVHDGALCIHWSQTSPRFASWLGAGRSELHFAGKSREAEIWHLIDTAGPGFAVKRWLNAPPAFAHHQYCLLQALRDLGLPVPQAVGWGDDQNDRGVLVTHHEGAPLSDPSRGQIQAAARALAQTHSVPVHAVQHLVAHDRGIDVLSARLFPDLQGQDDIGADVSRLLRAMHDWDAGFVHGDFHLGNIVERDGSLTVLDWSDARISDRRYDLAWAGVLLTIYSGHDAYAVFRETYREHALERWNCDELRRYEAIAGLRWWLLARTAPVPINDEWWQAARAWIRGRMGNTSLLLG